MLVAARSSCISAGVGAAHKPCTTFCASCCGVVALPRDMPAPAAALALAAAPLSDDADPPTALHAPAPAAEMAGRPSEGDDAAAADAAAAAAAPPGDSSDDASSGSMPSVACRISASAGGAAASAVSCDSFFSNGTRIRVLEMRIGLSALEAETECEKQTHTLALDTNADHSIKTET